jgi:hypothetical protein
MIWLHRSHVKARDHIEHDMQSDSTTRRLIAVLAIGILIAGLLVQILPDIDLMRGWNAAASGCPELRCHWIFRVYGPDLPPPNLKALSATVPEPFGYSILK